MSNHQSDAGVTLDDIMHHLRGMSVCFDRIENKMDRMETTMNRRFKEVDRRFEEVHRRFEEVDRRFDAIDEDLRAIAFDVVDVKKYVGMPVALES